MIFLLIPIVILSEAKNLGNTKYNRNYEYSQNENSKRDISHYFYTQNENI